MFVRREKRAHLHCKSGFACLHFLHFFFTTTLPVASAEVMKASQQAIERGVKDCLFIDYKRRSGHFDVTTVASIKEITDKVLSQRFSLSSDLIRKDKVVSICLFIAVFSQDKLSLLQRVKSLNIDE